MDINKQNIAIATACGMTVMFDGALDKDYAAYSLKLKEEKKRGIKQPKH